MISNKIEKGLIAWSKDEYKSILDEIHAVHQKPKDDWDLTKRSFILEDEKTGNREEVRSNNFHPVVQFSSIFCKKYPDEELYYAHSFRFYRICHFIKTYEQALLDEGLVQKEPKFLKIKDELLEALCILPFSKITKEKGSKSYSFSYQEIVDKAWDLIKRSK